MNRPRWIEALGGMPMGLIGALTLILGFEWFIVRNKEVTMDAGLWTYEQARRMATRKVKDCDLLAFGDSLTKHGVAPKVIQEVAGLKGSWPTWPSPAPRSPISYILFRDALRSGARPKAVVLDLFPSPLTMNPSSNANPSFLADRGDLPRLPRTRLAERRREVLRRADAPQDAPPRYAVGSRSGRS